MRINLQKFTLSTLTFSLATTLAVGGFSESASARGGGASYDKSNVQPALRFDAFFEMDNGDPILEDESSKDDDDIGIFLNAIKVDTIQINKNDTVKPLELELELESLLLGAEIFVGGERAEKIGILDNNPSQNDENFLFNLSAKQENGSIQYQIYQGDIDTPTTGIRFAPIPIEVPSSDSDLDFVNNIKDIIESSNNGEYGVEDNNGNFNKNGAGVLGLAINKSIRFIDEETKKNDGGFGDFPDILNIKLIPSQSATTIPEPSTALASLFAIGFAGKFLRKSKKNNA
ncbi:hypothetical protein [Calothrix sp. CCY 0018]|uniref:hypothetical protein n=1 Tax=Calothrix sp. CCY 0018 TaxID=3103864 RepID=UPI0039C717AD